MIHVWMEDRLHEYTLWERFEMWLVEAIEEIYSLHFDTLDWD